MTISNKVVWSEGLFLRPQHFQQQDRYFEHYIDSRCNAAGGIATAVDVVLEIAVLLLEVLGP